MSTRHGSKSTRKHSSCIPKYLQLQGELENKMKAGELQPGDQLPPERELVRIYGLGRPTVRRAISELAQQGLVEVRHGVGTFVTEKGRPTGNENGFSQVIAVISPLTADAFIYERLRGITQEAERHGYMVLICDSQYDPEIERQSLLEVVEQGAAAVIVYSVSDGRDDLSRIRDLIADGYPIVFIDRQPHDILVPMVGVDVVEGVRMSVAHLVELGHQRIAHIGNNEYSQSSVGERLDGYKQGLERAGISLDMDLVKYHYFPSVLREPDCRRLLQEYLVLQSPPTAFTVVNDQTAYELLYAARDLGLDVPGDLSVIGFDNRHESSWERHRLTTVAQPVFDTGVKAAQIAVEIIEKGYSEMTLGRHLLRPYLIKRGTTGPVSDL